MLFSVFVVSAAVAGGQQSQYVPGEVMVKFQVGSEASAALSQAILATPPNLELLVPTTQLLTEKTGIPLRAKQILSGGWVLIAVDANALTQRAITQLHKRDTVTGVEAKAGEPKGVGIPEMKDLAVSFLPGSPESGAIDDKLAGAQDGRFSELVSDLAKTLDLPLQIKADKPAHLIIQIDLRELTALLSQRLKAVPAVIDSVQLNYIMTIMPTE